MHTYAQAGGEWLTDGAFVVRGYSGKGQGKNKPEFEGVEGMGPIPCGKWEIGPPMDTESHGPYVLRLSPVPGTDTWNRSGFLIHGDSSAHPGNSSCGCIVIPRWARQRIWNSGDHALTVVEAVELGPEPITAVD